MIIEESVLIHALPEKVWDTFTKITCWKNWNTVLKDVAPHGAELLTKGQKIRLCIYPFSFPVAVEIEIEEVVPGKRIVWSGGKFGISARHEFIFEKGEAGVIVISREAFTAIGLQTLRLFFPDWKIRELTVSFLNDLKVASEK